MIVPIQRIPRYIMLLQDLLKRTPGAHPDFTPLGSALVQMKGIATHVNEMKRAAEGSVKLLEIQQLVKRCPPIVDPARLFVRELSCIEVRPSNPGLAKQLLDGSAVESGDEPVPAGSADKPGAAAGTAAGQPAGASFQGAEEAASGLPPIDLTDGAGASYVASAARTGGKESEWVDIGGDGWNAPTCEFTEVREMMLYLFNDMVLVVSCGALAACHAPPRRCIASRQDAIAES